MSQSNHTLESIAKMAGVSRSTVSRVINNKENVSDNARKKVLEIIKQVNYYPNASARSLASKKTNNIGVVFWGNNPLFLSPERIYSEIMQGIQKKVVDLNLDLMLYTSKNVDENFCYKIIGQKAVDGLIIMGDLIYVQYLRLFYDAEFPVVTIGKRYTNDLNVPYVCSDYINGIFKATEYLIKHNHKEIMIIVSDKNSLREKEKIKGYKNALKQHNLKFDEELIIERDEKKKFISLIEEYNEIDGIIATSDPTAINFMDILHENNYKIPQDLSIIGFDNNNMAKNTTPSLTTVHQRKRTLGNKAVDMLIKLVNGKKVRSKSLPTDLIVRKSTK